MNKPLPQCCSAEAFDLFRRQMRNIENPEALVAGAVAISISHWPGADVLKVNAAIDTLVDRVRSRVRGQQPQALLAHLHQVLFDEESFVGNAADYYNPANSFLPAVIESHKGLPITLSLLYKAVAERLGLNVWGVGMPGHFLVAVEIGNGYGDAGPALIDPFDRGRILTIDEAHDRMKELLGPEATWDGDILQPASNRHWLTRILQNLLHVYGNEDRYTDVAGVLEMEMLLWPEQGHLQRDLALVLARIGMAQPASVWLGRYLRNHPQDPHRNDLKQLLDVLRA
jgi:regulator of sirC expression with transglutaminase-like and TPR domain